MCVWCIQSHRAPGLDGLCLWFYALLSPCQEILNNYWTRDPAFSHAHNLPCKLCSKTWGKQQNCRKYNFKSVSSLQWWDGTIELPLVRMSWLQVTEAELPLCMELEVLWQDLGSNSVPLSWPVSVSLWVEWLWDTHPAGHLGVIETIASRRTDENVVRKPSRCFFFPLPCYELCLMLIPKPMSGKESGYP